jgi:hypothetical protein
MADGRAINLREAGRFDVMNVLPWDSAQGWGLVLRQGLSFTENGTIEAWPHRLSRKSQM